MSKQLTLHPTAIAKEIGKPELLSHGTTLLSYISYLCQS